MTIAASHPRPYPHPMPFPRASEQAPGYTPHHAVADVEHLNGFAPTDLSTNFDGLHDGPDTLTLPESALSIVGSTPVEAGSQNEADLARFGLRRWARKAGAYALSFYSMASPTSMGPVTPEGAGLMIDGNIQVAKSVGTRARDAAWEYRQLPKGERRTRLIGQGFAWGNLAFGEAIAVGVQGLVQGQNTSGSTSFGVGVGMAAGVDALLSYPATRPFKEKKSAHDVAEACYMAPWVGGGLASSYKELPRSQYLWPVSAYTVYGSLLAGAAELNNAAEFADNHLEVAIPAVVAIAGLRKLYDMYDYKTFSDRMARRTVNLAQKVAGTVRKLRGKPVPTVDQSQPQNMQEVA